MFDQTKFDRLVWEKLDSERGEYTLFAQYHQMPVAEVSVEDYKNQVLLNLSKRYQQKVNSLKEPPDPNLISIKSWQMGFTDAQSGDQVDRALRDAFFISMQSYKNDYISADRWKTCLDAFDHPKRWLALGNQLDDEGKIIEANVAYAAARWLDPASKTPDRPDSLPERVRKQPDQSYRNRKFADRHWCAWDMKNYGLVDIPTLLLGECDPNFSIRTRVYRSLGQRPHPGSIQALQEGSFDPHPFARAQAIRSLGWIGDPTRIDRIIELEESDPDQDVRRTAKRAAQRIIGYWLYFGQWNEIAGSVDRVVEVTKHLKSLDLKDFAFQVPLFCHADEDHPEISKLLDELEPFDLSHSWENEKSRYSYWFAEAAEVEKSLTDDPSPESIAELTSELTDEGWNARRIMRRQNAGIIAQRRRLAYL